MRWSRHVAERVAWRDPWSDPQSFVEALVAWARTCSEQPTLFYDGDWDLLTISRRRHDLAPSLRFVVGEADLVEDLVDKARFAALSERAGLPTPPAIVLRAREAGASDAAAVGFPAVVKPLTRHHETWRPLVRTKVARVRDREELDRLWDQMQTADIEVLVQREIPGPETAIESHHVYVDASGALVAEFTGRKLRTYPAEHGYTTACEITDAADVAAAGRDVLSRIGLTGVAKLDFKRADDGTLHLFEVNPRFTLWHYPAAVAGLNIPALVHADLSGVRRPSTRAARAGVQWVSLRDAQAARAAGLPLRRWGAWALRVEAKAQSVGDPGPTIAALLRRRA